jgi:hypothetical protein
MNVNWTIFKSKFLDLINKYNVQDFSQFTEAIKTLKYNGPKGTYFEYFCKLYFEIDLACK